MRLNPTTYLTLTVAASLAIFAAIHSGGAPATLAVLYVAPTLLAGWGTHPRLGYLSAALTTALLTLRVLLAPPPTDALAASLAHNGLLAVSAWIFAIALVHLRKAGDVRRRQEQERLAIEERLRAADKARIDIQRALDQSAIVASTNVRGDILYVNDKFCEISGYTRDELIGANHRLLNSGLHPREFFVEMYGAIAHGRVWRGELRNRAKDGSFYWVDTTIVPFLDERQHPYQYISIRYDITERKRSEAALRDQTALAQLGKMAAVVAHEVRNPLAGIRGALQVIGGRLPSTVPEHGIVHEVIVRIDTLNEIVQDLLVFARPTKPVLVPVTIAGIVSDTLGLFRQDPVAASVRIQVSASDAVVMADAEQIKMVLLNLLTNGAQAMQGTGTIEIGTRTTDGVHEIRIHDHGPGIAPEVREHLFEPFFTTRHRGTGLGLVTARRLMEAHGGTLTLDCPPDGGTVAVMTLPVR